MENDEFKKWTDENGPHLYHEENLSDPGAVILTYAYILTKDGGFYYP